MFCPNCGTQNDENNAKCQKCGFSIKGAASPKFKGTMLMMNAPPELAQRLASPAAAAPLPAGPAPSPVGAVPSPVSPAPVPVIPKKALGKATMIGVAPPSPGAVAPPAAKPASKTASIGQVAPSASKPLTSPLKPPASVPRPMPSSPPVRVSPAQPVNPFGGTMLMGSVPMQTAGSAGLVPAGQKPQDFVSPDHGSDRTISSVGAPPALSRDQAPDLNSTTPSAAPPTPAMTPRTLNEMPTVASAGGAQLEAAAGIPAPPFLAVSESGNIAEAATVPAPAGFASQPHEAQSFELEVPMNSRSPVLGVIFGILTFGIYWLVMWWSRTRKAKRRGHDA